MRTHHNLKIHPDFFDAVEKGDKTFEIRFNDRDFKRHDTLELREWNPRSDGYTGRVIKNMHITYVTDFKDGLRDGWVCFGIRRDVV